MRNKIIITAAVLFVLVAGLIVFLKPDATITITRADMESAIETDAGLITRDLVVSRGDTLEIKLFAAGYAGMRWSGGSENNGIIRQDGAQEYTGGFPFGGREGEKWTFKAIEVGQTVISLSYATVGIFDPPRPIVNKLKINVTVT